MKKKLYIVFFLISIFQFNSKAQLYTIWEVDTSHYKIDEGVTYYPNLDIIYKSDKFDNLYYIDNILVFQDSLFLFKNYGLYFNYIFKQFIFFFLIEGEKCYASSLELLLIYDILIIDINNPAKIYQANADGVYFNYDKSGFNYKGNRYGYRCVENVDTINNVLNLIDMNSKIYPIKLVENTNKLYLKNIQYPNSSK